MKKSYKIQKRKRKMLKMFIKTRTIYAFQKKFFIYFFLQNEGKQNHRHMRKMNTREKKT